jgi:hypothetical protein
MIADVTIHLSNEAIQVVWFMVGISMGIFFGVLFEQEAKKTQTLWHKVKK